MALTTVDDVLDRLVNLMGSSALFVSEDGRIEAVEMALAELNWTLPEADPIKCFWILERSRRHITYVTMLEQAHKFRYKQIHLQQRFENYFKLVSKMDVDFSNAVDDNPELFPIGSIEWLTEFIPAGFVYDQLGQDYTYAS